MYDVAIIGGGVAGMTAGIYAVRNGFTAAIFERGAMGGQIALTNEVENYPAVQSISGFELASNMAEQAARLGVEILSHEVTRLELGGDPKIIETAAGNFRAGQVILAMGAQPKSLGLAREQEFIGRGISYCAVCDAAFYRNKTAAVVGGGNTAVQDAMHLARFAKTVYLVHRRDEFRADQIEVEKLKEVDNIVLKLSRVPVEILGEKKIAGLVLENVSDHTRETLELDGVFYAVGYTPNTALVKGQVELDGQGYIVADAHMRTSLPGVFAAGDVIQKPLRQLITAENDGAIAASFLRR